MYLSNRLNLPPRPRGSEIEIETAVVVEVEVEVVVVVVVENMVFVFMFLVSPPLPEKRTPPPFPPPSFFLGNVSLVFWGGQGFHVSIGGGDGKGMIT